MPFLKRGTIRILQRNSTTISHPGAGCLISACDPYDAIYRTKAQALYLEIPPALFFERFPARAHPAPNTILKTGSGMGRVAAEFCRLLAKKSRALNDSSRDALREQIILAVALEGCQTDGAGSSTRRARLNSIKDFIDGNLTRPNLSLTFLAKSNDVSLSYMHDLFRASGDSVSEWIWLRRLQRC